jgi:two-component system, sensor histidine kinase LadS
MTKESRPSAPSAAIRGVLFPLAPGRLVIASWRLATACLVVAWLVTGAAAAHAGLIIDGGADAYRLTHALRYLEDPERRLAIEDVAGTAHGRFRPVAPGTGDINFGYSHAAYWLALPVRLAAGAPRQWLLEIAYPSLDRVEVYQRHPDGRYERQVAGDLMPFGARPYPHRNLVFPIVLEPEAEQTVYLRVLSAGNLTVPATLWQPQALHRHDQQSYALLSVYYGMLLALLLYNLLLYLAVRDAVFLAYVAFVAAMAVGTASQNGFGNQFLWPDWPAWGNVALPSGMSATGFFGAIFTRVFLGTRRQFPRLDRALLGFVALFAVSALWPVAGSYQIAAILTSLTGLAFSATAVGAGVYCHAKGHPGARYFLIAWTLLLVGVAVLAMRNFGWLPTTLVTTYSMQIGSGLEMLLLSFALADRINLMRREKERASREALAAQQAMVQALVRSEQELEARVAQRTEELADANALLRDKEKELHHLAHHDHLTGLANRLLLDDRLEHAIARCRRSGGGVAVLLVDLDGFKAVNDAHGHDAGDELLIAIAGRLSDSVRETDTVARQGGDEFVVVIEDIPGRAAAERVAEKIVAAVSAPVGLVTGVVQISASIGVALFPEHAGDRERLLRRADAAMYAAKSGGRRGWRMAGTGPDT